MGEASSWLDIELRGLGWQVNPERSHTWQDSPPPPPPTQFTTSVLNKVSLGHLGPAPGLSGFLSHPSSLGLLLQPASCRRPDLVKPSLP